MSPDKSQPIVFIVPGQAQPIDTTRGAAAAAFPQGAVKQSVRVGAQRSGGSATVRVSAVPGEDVVVMHIANGPALMLHPETARDLMLAQGETKRTRGAGGKVEPSPHEVKVPAELQWRGLEQAAPTRGATRGFLGDVLLSAVEVITGLGEDQAADFAASKVVERVDAQVDEGVYVLDAETLPQLKGSGKKRAKVAAAPEGRPVLVLVHGTFSNTNGTFGKLWTEHPQRVRALFDYYRNQIYALDHATLGKSPIENALTLAQALPKDARLHLVTHSRGGLVAEVLARVCGSSRPGSENLEAFAGKGYEAQHAALTELFRLVKERGIKVERIVRVACPARGTLLASGRLDAYVSVFKWTLELAGIPVVPAIVDFLGEVAKRRAQPEILPGLAAQMPDSPLVQWLHSVEEQVNGELRVVAGDIEGDSVVSWLKTLLADAFYWTDNDLVVQTRSMYGGAPRARGASFVLDRGGKVSHFSYFSNERTAGAIVNALMQDTPPGFRTIGPLSWAGESATGTRAAMRAGGDSQPSSARAAVFLLPGILGSNLKVNGKRIWLSWRIVNGLERLKYTGKADGVEPDGPIGLSYDDLAEFLSESHEVIEFAFDWRRPIEEEARRLGSAVEAALTARDKSGQPVRIIAHSMGGVVARTMQLERPDIWERMMARPGARLLMLGTPNGGSWAPMQTLSGDDKFSNIVVNAGAPFQDQAARELLANLPGFLQLQASLLDGTLGLGRRETWEKLAEDDLARIRERSWWHAVRIQLNAYRWGVPGQAVLDRAVALRKRLDDQMRNALPRFSDKLLLVVGKARFTPDGYEIGDEGLVYLDAQEDGDGRVTLQNALLPGVRTWTLDCEHGSLPGKEEAFAAYLDLLQRGDTAALPRLSSTRETRGAAAGPIPHVRSRPSRARISAAPPQSEREPLSVESREIPPADGAPIPALRITVVNGNLKFVREPLLLGHYRSTRLTGTEAVMDRLLDESMSQALGLGLYPDQTLTHQVFVNNNVNRDNPLQMPRPKAVIVVGLGEEGKLRAAELVRTVRQAVLGWAQRMGEAPEGRAGQFDMAATLMGSGGAGISAGQSAQLVAQGVREANLRLVRSRWPSVGHLRLIELYLDRATEAWRVLREQADSTPGYYALTETVQTGTGALRRPIDSSYRGTDYDFIAAVAQRDENGKMAISYMLDTKRARTEVRALKPQLTLLREMVVQASTHEHNNPQIGRSLFQLLVPIEVEPFLGGTSEMVIELNDGTAGIPWELLDTEAEKGGGGDKRPWAIRAKLLRKLRTAEYRAQVVDASADAHVLVVGEPKCTDVRYPRLPGARREAMEVAKRLTAPGALAADKVKQLIASEDAGSVGADALTVVNALLEKDWRIVHISGHGEPPRSDGNPCGVVLSNGAFLGPAEIAAMRTVPELVFVNCCHLAARNPDQLLGQTELDRAEFAAGVARKLIEIGVRCVVAAGWAVEDGPAMTFATTFYGALLSQRRFIDAVAQAREAAQALGGNTWAAYQCYGDPEWTFRREGADAQLPPRSPMERFGGVASSRALILALNTLEVESTYDIPNLKRQAFFEERRSDIRHLEARFGQWWGGIGEVAEAFASAWRAAGGLAKAMEWYERALAASDGSASLKASEQLANLRARVAAESVTKAIERRDELKRALAKASNGRGASRAEARTEKKAALAVAEQVLRKSIAAGRKAIASAIGLLGKVSALERTMERESLLGSAFKRLATIEAAARRGTHEARAIAKMKTYYGQAEALGRKNQLPDFFYPALNRMAAELVLNARRPRWKKFDAADVATVQQNLANKVRDDADFWSVVGLTELSLYQALADRALAGRLDSIIGDYERLHARVSDAWRWSSVYDQAGFVLPKYTSSGSAKERRAAQALLNRLKTLAEDRPAPA